LATIDRALLADHQLAGITEVRAEIEWMWPAIERFYAYGLGAAAIAERRVICWCTAEYVSAGSCGIGIATDPAYGRRGVATATAAHFIELCQRRGMAPFWECRANNPGCVSGFLRPFLRTPRTGSFALGGHQDPGLVAVPDFLD